MEIEYLRNMLFQPSKVATIGRELAQDDLTQDEGEYFSMGRGRGGVNSSPRAVGKE